MPNETQAPPPQGLEERALKYLRSVYPYAYGDRIPKVMAEFARRENAAANDEAMRLWAALEQLAEIIGGAERIVFESGDEYVQDEFGWRAPLDSLEPGYDAAMRDIDLLNCFADPDEVINNLAALASAAAKEGEL